MTRLLFALSVFTQNGILRSAFTDDAVKDQDVAAVGVSAGEAVDI